MREADFLPGFESLNFHANLLGINIISNILAHLSAPFMNIV